MLSSWWVAAATVLFAARAADGAKCGSVTLNVQTQTYEASDIDPDFEACAVYISGTPTITIVNECTAEYKTKQTALAVVATATTVAAGGDDNACASAPNSMGAGCAAVIANQNNVAATASVKCGKGQVWDSCEFAKGVAYCAKATGCSDDEPAGGLAPKVGTCENMKEFYLENEGVVCDAECSGAFSVKAPGLFLSVAAALVASAVSLAL